MELKSFQKEFDSILHTYLQGKLDTIQQLQLPENLQQVFEYILSYAKGGKRVRPYLVSLIYQGVGGKNQSVATKVGLAHELVHIFALIHDDIMDKGTSRHGVPTYHLRAGDIYHNDHVGTSHAILVGDLVYTRAIETLTSQPINDQVRKYFFEMLDEVIIGQSLDIDLSHSGLREDPSIIITKDKIKSGNYTFTKPMIVGAALGESNKIEQIQHIGEQFGLAYQMRDDLYDILDAHDNKTTFSDLIEGNQTMVLFYALQGLNTTDKEQLLSYRRQHLSDNDKIIVRELFEKSGAIEKTQEAINTLLDEAVTQSKKVFGEENIATQGLRALADYLKVTN